MNLIALSFLTFNRFIKLNEVTNSIYYSFSWNFFLRFSIWLSPWEEKRKINIFVFINVKPSQRNGWFERKTENRKTRGKQFDCEIVPQLSLTELLSQIFLSKWKLLILLEFILPDEIIITSRALKNFQTQSNLAYDKRLLESYQISINPKI